MQRREEPKITKFKELIGQNIRLFRKVSGLTGEQFAKELGISRNHLFNLENAKAYGIVYNAVHYIGERTDLNRFFKEDISSNLIRPAIKTNKKGGIKK
jgi:transcriptional regulator with XRE-family HTH domain